MATQGMPRRSFLKGAAGAAAVAGLTPGLRLPAAAQPAATRPADLVLKNGKIITIDGQSSIAQAIAVAGDRIIAVGPDAGMAAHIAPGTRVHDLNGRAVIPGLTDGHAHMDREALRNVFPALGPVRSIKDIQERIAELARGKTGRVIGHLMAMLTIVKGLPLAYNKDLQEDKEGVFDSYDTLSIVLRLYAEMLPKTVWHAEVTRAAAARGYSTATDVADFLARHGVPFREAHEVVGGLVGLASRSNRQLWELTDDELRAAHPLLNAQVAQALTVEESVRNRQSYGGTAPERVREAIRNARQALEIADIGYVLVQGANRYTGSGAELMADPEVRRTFLGG